MLMAVTSTPLVNPSRRSHPLVAAVAVLLCLFGGGSVAAQDVFDKVSRVVAVGDVHGGFDEFVAVLRSAGVIDGRNRWSGGSTHLVQTGDVPDRGPASRKVFDLLMDLEKQAPKAGGRVHALIGNHEVMNLIGDLRDVSDAEFGAFRTGDSAAIRDRAFELLADPARKAEPGYRDAWNQDHPLGWVEHRQAFGPKGKYGKWLRTHNAIVRVGDLLLMHGGLSAKYADLTLAQVNARVRQELDDPALLQGGMAVDEEGPLWYRGLAREPEAAIAPLVERLLQQHAVRHIVIGHTILAPAIVPRVNGKVVAIDVGLSAVYGGPPACLIAEEGRVFALHRGQKVELPQDGNVRAYLEKIAALDPQPSPLLKLMDALAPAPQPVGAVVQWEVDRRSRSYSAFSPAWSK